MKKAFILGTSCAEIESSNKENAPHTRVTKKAKK